MSSNEPKTVELPRYEDGDTTDELPVIEPEEVAVRLPDRSGITIVVGSELYHDGTTRRVPPSVAHTAKLPATRTRLTFRRLTQPVTSSRLIHALLAGNALVICVIVGLFIGGLWVASEVGVIPAVPGITQSDPKPEPAKTSEHKKEPRTPSATTSPGNWGPVVGSTASRPAAGSASPKASASASASASPSASASATAQPVASASATPPASPETSAPATTPSASTPAPTESSPAGEPTSSAPTTPASPTSEMTGSNPVTGDPSVTP